MMTSEKDKEATVFNFVSERDKHWNKLKFYAEKWRAAEDKERELKVKIIQIQAEVDQLHKEALKYSQKTRHYILVEVI